MPLVHSASSKALKQNMRTLYADIGKSPHVQSRAQAIAIAMETQRRAKRAMGGVVPAFDIGGAPPMPQPGMPVPAPGVVPMPGNAPVGVAPPQMGPSQPQGMNPAPGAMPAPVPGQPMPPQGQWASGVAQNVAPPANPQNAPPIPPNAAPAEQPMGKQLMANGGALPRAAGGLNMAKAPHLSPPWQTKSQDRQLHIGPVLSNVPGRTDSHRVKVPSGSYVLPAAHVSSMGQGNTVAGLSLASSMFGGGPYGTSAGRIARGPGAPKPPRMRGLADGGSPDLDYGQPVDVDISGGEYVIPPQAIIDRYGDLDTGHKILDAWVIAARKKEVDTLKRLPPPAKA